MPELDEHSLGVNVSEIEAPYTLDKRSRAEVAADQRHRLGEIPGAVVEIGQPISHRIDASVGRTIADCYQDFRLTSTAFFALSARK